MRTLSVKSWIHLAEPVEDLLLYPPSERDPSALVLRQVAQGILAEQLVVPGQTELLLPCVRCYSVILIPDEAVVPLQHLELAEGGWTVRGRCWIVAMEVSAAVPRLSGHCSQYWC